MTGAADAARVAKRVDAIADSLTGQSMRRALTKGATAGKKAALEVARDVAGPDAALSNFAGRGRTVRLGAGYDFKSDTVVAINLRPAGIWKLQDSGARPHRIAAQESRRSMAEALQFPGTDRGYAHSANHPGTRGKRAIRTAAGRIIDRVPRVTSQAILDEVERAWR